MKTKHVFQFLAAFGYVAAAASAAQAEVVQYNYNTNDTSLGTTPTLVPFVSGGGTSTTFVSKKAGWTVITFSAECAVYGASSGNWLTIDILIDGVAVDPTSGFEDAFCTEVTGEYIYGMHSITVAKSLAKGRHTLTVTARVTGDTGWLDDIAVLVSR